MNSQKLNDQSFRVTYGSFYPEALTDNLWHYIWNVIFILRRLQYSLIIVLLGDYPAFQIISQISISYLCMFYISKYKPFIDKVDNITELLNELTCLIVFCFLTTNVASTSSTDTQYNIGFFIIGVILINTVVNFLLFLKVNGQKIYYLIRKFWYKVRQYLAQRRYQEKLIETLNRTAHDLQESTHNQTFSGLIDKKENVSMAHYYSNDDLNLTNYRTSEDKVFNEFKEIPAPNLKEVKQKFEFKPVKMFSNLKQQTTFQEAFPAVNLKIKNDILKSHVSLVNLIHTVDDQKIDNNNNGQNIQKHNQNQMIEILQNDQLIEIPKNDQNINSNKNIEVPSQIQDTPFGGVSVLFQKAENNKEVDPNKFGQQYNPNIVNDKNISRKYV